MARDIRGSSKVARFTLLVDLTARGQKTLANVKISLEAFFNHQPYSLNKTTYSQNGFMQLGNRKSKH